MNCIYHEKIESNNLDDALLVINRIDNMVALIKQAAPDNYAHATFPRQYYEIVLATLKNHGSIGRIHNISCEMHVVNENINLELVKHHEKQD